MPSDPGLLRDARDRLPIALTLAHGAALCTLPGAIPIALLAWWNANAISHQHTHRRFFRSCWLDALFSAWLTLLLGVPQRLWRARHLAHHAGSRVRLRLDAGVAGEGALLLALWAALLAVAPSFFLTAYLPGIALALALCGWHGHYEHRGGTTSCYGRAWNLLFLNDGYHVEHHAAPRAHAGDLPALRVPGARHSRWPPVLRFLEARPAPVARVLDGLERAVLRWPALQRPVLHAHRRALRALLADLPVPRRAVVVGGGLFPRTAMLVCELWPQTEVVVLDADAEHLERARQFLPAHVQVRCGRYVAGERLAADVVFLPLALRGDRARAYTSPPAPVCVVHDWIWRRRATGRVVAWWLGKRVNLVGGAAAAAGAREAAVAAVSG